MGYTAPDGIYRHEEHDPADPGGGFSDLLNLVAKSISPALADMVAAAIAEDPTIEQAILDALANLDLLLRTDPEVPRLYTADGIIAAIGDSYGQGTFMAARPADGAPTAAAAALIARALRDAHVTTEMIYDAEPIAAITDERGQGSFLTARESDGAPTAGSGRLIARTLTELGFIGGGGAGGEARLAGPFVAIGDSLTENGAWRDVVAALLHTTVINMGQSGDTSTGRALDAGVLPGLTVTIAGDMIPASGSVAVTAVTPGGSWRPGVTVEWSTPARIAGVDGTLVRENATNGGWRFDRRYDGTATACPPGSAVQVLPGEGTSVGYERLPTIVWVGRNNTTDLAAFQRDVAAIVAAYDVRLIISVTNMQTEPAGSAGYARVQAMNGWIEETYPALYWDGRGWLIAHGLDAAGITPTAADMLAISEDRIPPSLMNDDTHPTAAASAALGEPIAQTIRERGL